MISAEMIPIILAFVCIAVMIAGLIFITITSVPFKNENARRGEGALPKDFIGQFIKAYNKTFETYDMKPMTNMLTDFMHYSTENTVKVLSKLGIKKKVELTIDKEYEKNKFVNFVIADGKNDFTIDNSKCVYTETYTSADSDNVLYKRRIKDAIYCTEFLKSSEEIEDKTWYCLNCGAELHKKSNFFECECCDSHYDSELLKWTASDIDVKDNNSFLSKVLMFSIVGMVLLCAIEMAVKIFMFGLILSIINITAIVGFVLYYLWVYKTLLIYTKMKENDPKFSRMAFQKRIYYLIRILEMARDFDLEKIEAYMLPELYNKIKENNKYDDYYVVDIFFKRLAPTSYRIDGDKQIVDMDISYEMLLMNPNKKIKLKRGKRHYAMYKHIEAKTTVNTMEKTISCPNCGANINLTTSAKCRYCDVAIDVSKYDWVFYDAPVEVTK